MNLWRVGIKMNPRQALSIIKKKYPDTEINLNQIITNLATGEILVRLNPCKKNTHASGYCMDSYTSDGGFVKHECKVNSELPNNNISDDR